MFSVILSFLLGTEVEVTAFCVTEISATFKEQLQILFMLQLRTSY